MSGCGRRASPVSPDPLEKLLDQNAIVRVMVEGSKEPHSGRRPTSVSSRKCDMNTTKDDESEVTCLKTREPVSHLCLVTMFRRIDDMQALAILESCCVETTEPATEDLVRSTSFQKSLSAVAENGPRSWRGE